jgi:hypothetical protein
MIDASQKSLAQKADTLTAHTNDINIKGFHFAL